MRGGAERLLEMGGAILADGQQTVRQRRALVPTQAFKALAHRLGTAVAMLSPVSAANSCANRWASSFLIFKLMEPFHQYNGSILPRANRGPSRAAASHGG